jgi:hypothetical protein
VFGDFSRLSYNPNNHFSAVWMQQGRVQLDADWNEMVAIASGQITDLARAVIGFAGAPVQTAGFEIQPRYGYQFDGQTNYLSLGQEASTRLNFSQQSPFTINLRLNFTPPNKPAPGQKWAIFGNRLDQAAGAGRDGGEANQGYSLSIEQGRPVAETPGENAVPDPDQPYLIFSCFDATDSKPIAVQFPILPRCWTLITVTYDGLTLNLYQNRILVATQPVQNIAPAEKKALVFIGAQNKQGTPDNYFNGLIDEVRVWQQGFSATEVVACLPLFSEPGDPQLLLNWDFKVKIDQSKSSEVNDPPPFYLDGIQGRVTRVIVGAWVLPGEYFVNGWRCVNPTRVSIGLQPYLAALENVPTVDDLKTDPYLFYLEVWERYVSPQMEPSLREVALEGLDTTARSQIIWQMRSIPFRSGSFDWLKTLYPLDKLSAMLSSLQPYLAAVFPTTDDLADYFRLMLYLNRRGNRLARGYLTASHDSRQEPINENQLYRVEIHYPGETEPDTFLPDLTITKVENKIVTVKTLTADWRVGQTVIIYATNDASSDPFITTIAAIDVKNLALTLQTEIPDGLRTYTLQIWRKDPANLNPQLIVTQVNTESSRAVTVQTLTGLLNDWPRNQPILVYAATENTIPPLYTTISDITLNTTNTYTLTLEDEVTKELQGQTLRILRLATVKWSRSNGAILFKVIAKKSGDGGMVVTLAKQGENDILLKPNMWVELVDETFQLQQKPGPMYQIQRIGSTLDNTQADTLEVTLNTVAWPPGLIQPYLRLWDVNSSNNLIEGTIPLTKENNPLTLEKGISVRFDEQRLYNSGDFWTIPARALINDIVWGGDGPHPPQGGDQRYAPISLTTPNGDTWPDLRVLFMPLTSASGPSPDLRSYFRTSDQ